MNQELQNLLLENRGIAGPEEKEKFLNPSYDKDIYDPYLMKNMEKAVVRIFEAIEAKEKIIIYSDYDCDGIPGAVILHDLFKKIGYPSFEIYPHTKIEGESNFGVGVYIPDRQKEGYGLNHEAIGDFIKREVKLLITVDLGITDVEEIANAQANGIDVIVTDHHLPKTQVNADLNADERELIYGDLTYKIRGCIFNVYNKLGPGLKENIYGNALEEEFKKNSIFFKKEKIINVFYENKKVGTFRPDFIIDEKIILELKSIFILSKLEKKQIWNYLKGSEYKLALLVNFGGSEVEIERIVYDKIRENPSRNLYESVLPSAYAILNPKQVDDKYPEKMLCGAGVAFKLVQAFLQKYGEYFGMSQGWEKWLLDMVGIATLSDQVPLLGENRVLAVYGLKVLQKNRRIGLQKLWSEMKIDARYLTEDDITFMLAPRLNAASRMASPRLAFEALVSEDEGEAGSLAQELIKINKERKILVSSISKEIKKTMEKREMRDVIVIGSPRWRPGILGLVATKLVEEYNRPVFVWGKAHSIDSGQAGGDCIKGSCRSVEGVNLVEVMSCLPEGSILDFGGHEMAGGFSVSGEQIHFLEEKLSSTCALLRNTNKYESTKYENKFDKKMSLDDVTMANYKQIEELAPFGVDNPKPTFLFERVVVSEIKKFGKNKEHLEIAFTDETLKKVKAIQFFKDADSFNVPIEIGKIVNLVANFELSKYGWKEELRLRIVDIIKQI